MEFCVQNFGEEGVMVESFVEGVVKNFIAGVGFFVKKTKEVEDDIRKKWCDYPSA